MTDRCEHFDPIEPVPPRTAGCAECIELGATWTELRVCLTCGHVGCCEDSKHAHALAHFHATGHPIIVPQDSGKTWSWCYVHGRYFDPVPIALPWRRASLAARLARLFRR